MNDLAQQQQRTDVSVLTNHTYCACPCPGEPAPPGDQMAFQGVISGAERTARLYHLPFTRDAASVVSRFLWKELNDLRVKVVLRAFQVRHL